MTKYLCKNLFVNIENLHNIDLQCIHCAISDFCLIKSLIAIIYICKIDAALFVLWISDK